MTVTVDYVPADNLLEYFWRNVDLLYFIWNRWCLNSLGICMLTRACYSVLCSFSILLLFGGGLKCPQNKILSPFVLVTVWPRKHQNDPWGQLQSEGLMWVSDVVADCFGNKCLGGELSDRWRDEHNVLLCELSQCEISCSFIRHLFDVWCWLL